MSKIYPKVNRSTPNAHEREEQNAEKRFPRGTSGRKPGPLERR
jgi:hypothetical protein